jgi:hypothetical protein
MACKQHLCIMFVGFEQTLQRQCGLLLFVRSQQMQRQGALRWDRAVRTVHRPCSRRMRVDCCEMNNGTEQMTA